MAITLANKITSVRILLVPVFICTILYYEASKDYLRWYALGIFVLAALCDLIDGYVARTFNQKTKVGAFLDPLADKLLLISAFLCLLMVSKNFPYLEIPIWLVVAVISRDVILFFGITVVYMVKGDITIAPTFIGKSSTAFQMFSVVVTLLQWNFSFVIWYITLGLSILSLLDYMRAGIHTLNDGASREARA